MKTPLLMVLCLFVPLAAHAADGKIAVTPSATTPPAVIIDNNRNFNPSRLVTHDVPDIETSQTGDIDFANNMLAQHQNSVEIARLELVNGKDSRMRHLAQQVLADQQKQIETLKNWLDTHQR